MREGTLLRLHRHVMLALAVVISFVGACDWESPRATTMRTSDEGTRAEQMRVRTWDTRARFECLQSTPGPCLVTVYTSACDRDAPADLGPDCRPRTLHSFRLAAGEARDADRLPAGFRWCLRHGPAGEPFCRRT
jgi:hypothetical protein